MFDIAYPHLYLNLCTLLGISSIHALSWHNCLLVLFECAIIDVCGMVVSTRFCKLLKSGARLAPSRPMWTLYLARWGLLCGLGLISPASLLGSFWEGEVLNSPVWEPYSEQRFPASENQKIIPSQRRYMGLFWEPFLWPCCVGSLMAVVQILQVTCHSFSWPES